MTRNSQAAAPRLHEISSLSCNRTAFGNEQRLKALLLRGLAGEGRAYHAFLKELAAHLRAFVRKRLARLPDEVEDIVQESLLAVHNQRHTYEAGRPLTAWVHAIARYKLVDAVRRRGKGDLLMEPLDDAAELLQTAAHEVAHARRDLAELLGTLPERQRLPIVHVKLEGRSVVETARLTGMSESAVKVAIHRGLKALARKWTNER